MWSAICWMKAISVSTLYSSCATRERTRDRESTRRAPITIRPAVAYLAAIVVVERVEDGVRVRPFHIEAKSAHGPVELALVDGARAILIPRAEQVDHAGSGASEGVAQREEQVL